MPPAGATIQQVMLTAPLLSQAQTLSEEAGWNQTAEDWQVFLRHGTAFGVLAGGRLVATAAVLPYGTDFAWISMVLVTAEFRRRGLARGLLQRCIATLRADGRAALLDATEAGAPIYRALGFTTLTRMTRWAGPHDRPRPIPSLAGLRGRAGQVGTAQDIADHVLRLDSAAFGASRGFLHADFLARPGAAAWPAGDAAALLRPGRQAWHIGPVTGPAGPAAALLAQAIDAAHGPVIIDLLQAGEALAPMLLERGLTPRRGFCRMALGRNTLPGQPAQLLAAAGPEFG